LNPRQLHYAIELAKTCSFSRASENLNITQPALSRHIMLLEKELGVKLFDRDFVPMKLTAAGEHFIREAYALIEHEKQLKRSMESFSTGERGRVTIGVSQFRGLYLIPSVVRRIRERFPGVEIIINDTNSRQIRKGVAEGKLDLAIVNLPVDDSVFDYIPIEQEIPVLAVPNEFLEKIPGVPSGNLQEIDFKDCADIPFVVVEQNKEMRILFDRLCEESDLCPDIVMEVVGITTAWAMSQAGIGATLVPLQFIEEDTFFSGNNTLFKIRDNQYRRQPVIITRRGRELSEYVQFIIKILTEEKICKVFVE